jgi:hypothetical protein
MTLIVCYFRVLYCFTQRLPQEGRSHPIPGQQADKTAGRQPSWKWRYSHGQYTDHKLQCDFSVAGSQWHKVTFQVTISENMAQQLQIALLFKFKKCSYQFDTRTSFLEHQNENDKESSMRPKYLSYDMPLPPFHLQLQAQSDMIK